MNPVSWVGSILSALASLFSWGRQRSLDANTPEMKRAASAARDSALSDKISADIARGDLDAVRRDSAEAPIETK